MNHSARRLHQPHAPITNRVAAIGTSTSTSLSPKLGLSWKSEQLLLLAFSIRYVTGRADDGGTHSHDATPLAHPCTAASLANSAPLARRHAHCGTLRERRNNGRAQPAARQSRWNPGQSWDRRWKAPATLATRSHWPLEGVRGACAGPDERLATPNNRRGSISPFGE